MSQPVPEVEKRPSVFPVPAHVHNVLLGGGCGVTHVVQNGAIDCLQCFEQAKDFVFPPAPEAAAAEPATAIAAAPAVDTPAESDPAPAKARAKTQPTE